MIITGILTLLIAVAFWYVIFNTERRNLLYFVILIRFLFPDTPTTAWFLTPAERTTAVQRIKVVLLF